MEVRIGVKQVAREITIETESSAQEVMKAVEAAIESENMLSLSDAKGGTVIVPASSLAYVHIGEDKGRKVGFGL